MKSRIIFLDIDGTLTKPGSNEPPQSALYAIREAQANGHKVFLCTGRNYEMLKPLLKYGFDGVIASSGGYVECEGESIYKRPLKKEESDKILGLLEKNGIFYTIECFDGAFTHEGFKDFLKKNANEGSNSELLRWREQIEGSLNIRPLSEYAGQPIFKFILMSDNVESFEEPRKELKEGYNFVYQGQDKFGIVNGEVISDEYDKGQAVERVCAHYGFDIADTVAYGDSMNDREMLLVAGLSICMEDGNNELKNIVDDICPSVGNDGIYRSFLQHGLI